METKQPERQTGSQVEPDQTTPAEEARIYAAAREIYGPSMRKLLDELTDLADERRASATTHSIIARLTLALPVHAAIIPKLVAPALHGEPEEDMILRHQRCVLFEVAPPPEWAKKPES